MPLQRPHPPIVIGGGGERKTLRLVARYADACNLFAFEGTDVLKHKLDVLRRHCADEGREYDALLKTVTTRIAVRRDGRLGALTPTQAVESLQALAALGFGTVECIVPDAHDPAALELFGSEVIPAVAAL
jgi:alkanesulfonate monooxygenase SsuD/methylene tetrahydromethanopterin reductase-like flavin-dependent oxidoreductase (luciferase family)